MRSVFESAIVFLECDLFLRVRSFFLECDRFLVEKGDHFSVGLNAIVFEGGGCDRFGRGESAIVFLSAIGFVDGKVRSFFESAIALERG